MVYSNPLPPQAGAIMPARQVNTNPTRFLTGWCVPLNRQGSSSSAGTDGMKEAEKYRTRKKKNMAVVPMKSLLESGVHFGHRTHKWHPAMKPYIFTERNGIHIIDLQKTSKA